MICRNVCLFVNSSWSENSSARKKLALLKSCWINHSSKSGRISLLGKGTGLGPRLPSGELRELLYIIKRGNRLPGKLGRTAELCTKAKYPRKAAPGLRCGRGTEDKRREKANRDFPREKLCALWRALPGSPWIFSKPSWISCRNQGRSWIFTSTLTKGWVLHTLIRGRMGFFLKEEKKNGETVRYRDSSESPASAPFGSTKILRGQRMISFLGRWEHDF